MGTEERVIASAEALACVQLQIELCRLDQELEKVPP